MRRNCRARAGERRLSGFVYVKHSHRIVRFISPFVLPLGATKGRNLRARRRSDINTDKRVSRILFRNKPKRATGKEPSQTINHSAELGKSSEKRTGKNNPGDIPPGENGKSGLVYEEIETGLDQYLRWSMEQRIGQPTNKLIR